MLFAKKVAAHKIYRIRRKNSVSALAESHMSESICKKYLIVNTGDESCTCAIIFRAEETLFIPASIIDPSRLVSQEKI